MLLVLLVLLTPVHAAGLVEPLIGSSLFSISQQLDSNGETGTASASGKQLSLGVRVGYSGLFERFFVGASYRGGIGSYSSAGYHIGSISSSGGTYSVTSAGIGILAGVKLPLGFRVWGEYGVLEAIHVTSRVNDVSVTYSGDSARIGVGYSIWSWLNVNLEGALQFYPRAEGGDEVIQYPYTFGANRAHLLKSTTWTLSVSAPWELEF